MYEAFFRLREKPFSLLPDHRFLYLNRRYQLALSLLEFGVLNNNGMILLTGDPGTGKTTLLQKILSTVDSQVVVGKLSFTQDKGNSILPWVLNSFGLQTDRVNSADLFQVFSDFFCKKGQGQLSLLLVVDEAQNLDVEQLEELRLLFNLNDRQGFALQILLAGHTQLREQLHAPQLEAFVQRIGTDFSLEPFSQTDSKAYILHRVQAVGGSSSLFSDSACHLIYRYSKGNPRLINQLCETSLMYGFSDQIDSISERLVMEAAKDRLEGGLLPLAPIDEISLSPAPSTELKSAISNEEFPQPSPKSLPSTSDSLMAVFTGHWKDAMKLKDQGWHLEAIRMLKMVAEQPAYHRDGWFHVGQCYLSLGRHSAALEAFQCALGDSPNQPPDAAPIYYAIGKVSAAMGRQKEAKRFADLAWLADPSFETSANGHSHFQSPDSYYDSISVPPSKPSWLHKWLRPLWPTKSES